MRDYPKALYPGQSWGEGQMDAQDAEHEQVLRDQGYRTAAEWLSDAAESQHEPVPRRGRRKAVE